MAPVCNPNRINEDLRDSWADGAAQEFCPILAGKQHSEEDDCRCTQALQEHGEGLQEFMAMNCLMPMEGGELAHLLNDWPERMLAKCYEGRCSEHALFEETKDLPFFADLAKGCPVVDLENPEHEHLKEHMDKCECARTLRDLDSELRPVAAFDCWVSNDEGGRMSLLDGWAPQQLDKCSRKCDLDELKTQLGEAHDDIVDACPVFRHEEMHDECRCAKTTQEWESELRANPAFDCFVEFDDDLVKLLDEWVPRVIEDKCHEPHHYMCNPDEIAEATREHPFHGELIENCPLLDGGEHTEENDCPCAGAVMNNFDALEGIPQMQCHLELDGRIVHLLHQWTRETLEKCGPKIPEEGCDSAHIADSLRHFDFYFEMEMACPTLRGEEHGPEHECECSKL